MDKQSKQPLLPVYLLVGDDGQKKEVLENRMRKRFCDLGDPALNTESFSAQDADVEGIINACLTLPFACGMRLVILKNADGLKTQEQNELADYLKNPASTSVLFLTAKKLAKNTRLYKSIEAISKTCIVDCASPKSYEFKNYVLGVAKTKGVAFDRAAIDKFLELVGNDTVLINTEIDKLAAKGAGKAPISVEDLEMLVSRSADVKPWDLTDAFSAKDLAKVLELSPQIKKNTPISILIMCVARVRELICARDCIKNCNGKDVSKAIASELGFSPALSWRFKNHASWARKWSSDDLRRCFCSSVEAEKEMKSGEDQLATLNSWFIKVLT